MSPFRAIIDGIPIDAEQYRDVLNPATGEVIGQCPYVSAPQVEAAVASAKAAFGLWGKASDEVRRAACVAIADTLESHAEALAQLLTREQGKPLNGMGSRYEVAGAVAWARHTAQLELPPEILQDDGGARIALYRKPVGVVASITPWNWPLMIAIWHLAPAIRSGCTVVIKPSPYTPLSTLRMVELLNEVLPAGVLNVVTGDDEIGPILTGHVDVAKVVFTGSTATGRKVMQSAAGTLKRLTLELGGNDAGIVLPDADPIAIAEDVFWGAFINNGQTCAALKRLYVHDSHYEDVCAALTAVATKVPMGDGLDELNMLGPVQNAMQLKKVTDLVDRAKASGARVLVGGVAAEGPGLFYPITLLADVSDGMAIVDEEQFGPVLPIIRYHDVEEAIALANASENGLGGSIWSSDLAQAQRFAKRLECGTAWINKHGAIRPDVPFGGVKASGIGVEFGRQGLEEYTTIQVIHQ